MIKYCKVNLCTKYILLKFLIVFIHFICVHLFLISVHLWLASFHLCPSVVPVQSKML